jgi:hypothetical protein
MKSLLLFISLIGFVTIPSSFAEGKPCSPLVKPEDQPGCEKVQGPSDIEWDIPSLKLNFEDLDQIFKGAESGGGYRTDPRRSFPSMRETEQPIAMDTKMLLNLSCEARLLGDGGKTVSWLSTAKFVLNDSKKSHFIKTADWVNGLIKGNNLSSKPVIVKQIPPYKLNNFSIRINTGNAHLRMKTCQMNMKEVADETVGVCTESESLESAKSFVNQFTFIDRDSFLNVNKYITLRVTCTKR